MSEPAKRKHHWAGVPANAGVRTYLHIAKAAIKHHDKAAADDALSHAETRLLNRSVPQSSTISADDSPAIQAIESARKALSAGDFATAASDTDQASMAAHGQ